MIAFSGRGILLDIEGTTSSVSFVYDVMFPLVREQLDEFLSRHFGDAAVADACDQIAVDAGHESLAAWRENTGADTEAAGAGLIAEEVRRLMDGDVKATGLKQLQGLIWKHSFESGKLQAHVYPDVAPALRRWREAGIDLRIYSSGSVQAQKLFFKHTIEGNLLELFSGHYDTTTGGKKEIDSYAAIASHWGLPPSELLFASDVVAELDAASNAGLQTVLCLRPGNAPVDPHDHPAIESFDQLNSPPLGEIGRPS